MGLGIYADGKALTQGTWEFRPAQALVTALGTYASFGDGVAFYRNGVYRGYHMLPDSLATKPLQEAVATPEFQAIFRFMQRR